MFSKYFYSGIAWCLLAAAAVTALYGSTVKDMATGRAILMTIFIVLCYVGWWLIVTRKNYNARTHN
ncbi:hypothetical protein LCGC14_1462260 [marine sediment metagenome]|uniref:Uncharacterized protein n=1 Tax=marine sediment metagenome TaxID=412755 RepID=A0A0F9JES9_9ZZZZ